MTSDLAAAAGVAAVAFCGTNVDNLLMAAAQVAAAKPHRVRRILIGQALSAVVVIGVSATTAAVLSAFSARWIGLLGLVPLALGIVGLFALRDPAVRSGDRDRPQAGGFFLALLIGLGASGDNLAVYIPLFRSGTTSDGVVTGAVLVALEAVLVLVALGAGRHPTTRRVLERVGAYAAPLLYVVIGVVIILRAGTLSF